MGTAKLGPFKGGMNNVAPDHGLPDDPRRGVHFVRDAVNADTTSAGTLRRRVGYVKKYVANALRSAWSDGVSGYVVDNGVLKRLTVDDAGGLGETVITNAVVDLSRGAAFVKAPQGILVSDGFGLYRIDGNTLVQYSATAPSFISLASSGDKEIIVTVTANVDGIDSAPALQVRVTGDYPVTVEIPSSYIGKATLYCSAPNGTELYKVGDFTSTTKTVSDVNNLLDVLTTTGLADMPVGDRMYVAFGRLWSVKGSAVFYSEPYRFNQYDPTSNFVLLDGDVRIFSPTNHGFIVATDSEIGFISGGDTAQFSYRTVLPYGAVSGTDITDLDNTKLIFTKRGLVRISQEGEATPIHEGKVAVDIGTHGSSGLIYSDGDVNVVTSIFNPELSKTSATSFMDAEIVRKEIQL